MEGKMKISFGIKTSKQVSLPKKAPAVNDDVEYIRSFDRTCKPMSMGESHKGDTLVIPSRANHTSLDQLSKRMTPKVEDGEQDVGGRADATNTLPFPSGSLEQMAAQELLKDAKDAALHGVKGVDVVPLPSDKQLLDAKEATLEDYESIPVEEFGKAMLRGMGWEPNRGIGKNQRVVAPAAPQLRPKGLGLGADRVIPSTNQPTGSSQQGAGQEDVAITIGCGVQIVAGGSGGLYGKVVSHNEDTGRCIVQLEIGASCVSVSESLVKVVGKEEYAKNCRVLNASKYKKYKKSSDDRLQEMRDGAASSLAEWPSRERRGRSRSPH